MFAEVLLPLPLQGTYTYSIPEGLAQAVRPGHRVLVQFGTRKFYTGIVISLTPDKPEAYSVKPIISALDSDGPILRYPQLKLWEWVSDYYLCTLGEVMKAALPAALKVESETQIEPARDATPEGLEGMTEAETCIFQVLTHHGKRMNISQIEKATGFKNVSATVSRMLEKRLVIISENLQERYVPKRVEYVELTAERHHAGAHEEMFRKVSRSQPQQNMLLSLLELSGFMHRNTPLREVTVSALLERSALSRATLRELVKKGIVRISHRTINRFAPQKLTTGSLPTLSEPQKIAIDGVESGFRTHDIVLLHGVTSSGKTEIYLHLIEKVLARRQQVLYLVPEIALTTQLTERLQRVFGSKVIVYHSRFSDSERVDLYRKILTSVEPFVVLGPRSSVFLPFGSLGLVIVDEEHEPSFKQQDPAPRYNGRDTAMVLARMHGAKVLLGSATPAVDTYFKALGGRYGLVSLTQRHGGGTLPEISLVDTTQARKDKLMRGALAAPALSLVRQTVQSGRQAIVFINRRGYAPVAQCNTCGWVPRCEHCDVSLTYHKRLDRLVCHYCGTQYPLPAICPACHEPAIEVRGYGTERMEDELLPELQDVKVIRMDLDTTRNKDDYQNLIQRFSSNKAQVLVGTQMVTKGLDFGHVTAVVIVNADSLINQPDFRSTERAFNMISQVAGRAGRRNDAGEVMIQTRQPSHPIFRHITAHDYIGFYEEELLQRQKFFYPPFTRLINIYIKHKEPRAVENIAEIYAARLRQLFGNRVFGPEEPGVSRIQTFYIRKIMLKIETAASMKKVKEILRRVYEELHTARTDAIRGAVVYYDVDPV